MKNCNKHFAVKAMYVFVAFVLFALGVGVKRVEGQCSLTLNMYDSYGDSWNGGYLTVYFNGVSQGTFSASGSGSSASLTIPSGQTFSLSYTSGSWEEENTYNVQICGNTVFSDGTNPATGTVFTYNCLGQITDNTIYANGNNNSITVCQNETFTISSSGGNTSNFCYWASDNGGGSWNIFAQSYCNQASFNYSLSAVGTYLFHVRNYDNCGYCWDASHGTNCTCGASGSDCIVTVNVVAPNGDQTTYGTNSWIGYVYNPASYGAFTNYIGYVTENETFNRSHTNVTGATENLCYNPSDLFTIRYKMNKTFPAGWYNFTVGGDDGVRLSINGGSTWLVNGWALQGYTTYSSGDVYLDGNYNLVFEYYENTGGAQSSFSYTYTPPPANNNCSDAINLTIGSPSTNGTLNYAGDYNVWYKFTPSCTGSHTVTLSGLSDDKDLYVYSGTCSSLTYIGSSASTGTSNETVTYSFTGGQTYYIEVYDYANTGGNFNIQVVSNIPDYSAQIVSINYGSGDWCTGETRTVSVQVQNTGQATWTNSGPDINLGLKWNNNGAYWNDYHVRTNVGGQACGETQTYNLNITAQDATAGPSYSNNLASGSNNLNVNLVYEGCFWFYYGSGTYWCATLASMPNYTSPAINIKPIPTAVSAGSDFTICNGSSANLSGSASGSISSSASSTYSLGNGSSEYNTNPATSTNSTCPLDLSVSIPAGAIITSVDVSYNMTAVSSESAWMSEQRSYLECISSGGTKEANISSGSGNSSGTYSYTRTSLNIANGVTGGGNIQFRLHTFRTWGGSGCNTTYNYVNNNTFTITVYYTIPTTYSWSPTTGLNNPNISNPIASPSTGITTYTMTADLNGCGVSDDAVVTVQSTTNNPGVISVPSEICIGTPTNISNVSVATTGTPASSGPNYYFYYRGGPLNIGWQMYDGPTTNSSSALPVAVINTPGQWYVARNSQFGCTGQTNDVNTVNIPILVNPNFTPGAINTTGETICYNGNPSIIGSSTAASGGDGTITYKWQANGVDIASSNSAAYDPPTGLTSNTTYTRWAHDGSCNPSWTQSTGSWVVTVRPNFTAGAINTTGETICYNGNPGVIGSSTVASGGDGTITYKWQANGVDIASSNSTTYDPPAGLTATTTYTRWAKDNTCNTTFTQSSGSWVVTVRPEFTPGAISTTGETICEGEIPSTIGSSTASSGGDGVISYKWQANGVDIPSSNSASFTPSEGITANTTYTRWAHDGTCNTSWEQSTGSWTVTVTQAPFPTGITAGDYFWTGADNTSWDNTDNWLYYNGADYSVATVLPTSTSDVFIQSYSGTCATTNAITSASSTVYCQDMNIETGLTLGGLSTIEVTGNWNNLGTFTAGTGTVTFNGSAQQTITTNGETFNNVVINNNSGLDAAILLNNDLRVGGQLTLTNGIVSFANPVRKLILGNSATTNAGNANSFVDGIVEKTSCSALITLPTGNINTRDIGAGNQTYKIWAPIGLNPSSSTTVNARYLFSNDGLNQWWYHDWTHEAPLTHTSAREYWLVNSSVNTTVTLHWKDNAPCTIHDFCDGATFDNTDLTVAYWDNIWKNAGGTASVNYIDGSITSESIPFGAKGERQITFGSKDENTPLPTELISYKAECIEGLIEFNWATASETNNDYFAIEMSKDMINFEQIVKIQGTGNSNSINQYQELIETKEDYNYFRLVQVDFDGKTTIYPTIVVNCGSEQEIEPELIVYPNPFNNDFYVELNNFSEKNATIQIIDELGKIIYQESISELNMNNVFYLNPTNLKPSMYQLRVVTDKNVINQKIIKK